MKGSFIYIYRKYENLISPFLLKGVIVEEIYIIKYL